MEYDTYHTVRPRRILSIQNSNHSFPFFGRARLHVTVAASGVAALATMLHSYGMLEASWSPKAMARSDLTCRNMLES